MSKTIEVSDQDYARIQHAADADGMPVGAWVVKKLPLNGNGTAPEPPLPDAGAEHGQGPSCQSTDTRPPRTMADRFAGRVGLIDSGGDGRLSQDTGEKFTDYLEEKRRAGRL